MTDHNRMICSSRGKCLELRSRKKSFSLLLMILITVRDLVPESSDLAIFVVMTTTTTDKTKPVALPLVRVHLAITLLELSLPFLVSLDVIATTAEVRINAYAMYLRSAVTWKQERQKVITLVGHVQFSVHSLMRQAHCFSNIVCRKARGAWYKTLHKECRDGSQCIVV